MVNTWRVLARQIVGLAWKAEAADRQHAISKTLNSAARIVVAAIERSQH